MIITSVESVANVRGEIQPLLERHYQELTVGKEVVVLEVDWDKYENLERMNMLSVVTARDEGVLIGYSVFFIYSHMHYKSLKAASNDVLFLDKEYRKGRAGLKLLKESEIQLARLGVRKITWHIKTSLDWSKILLRMGYAQEELVMGKLLEVCHGS